MNTISLKLDKKDIAKLVSKYQDFETVSNNPYIYKMFKTKDLTISIYTNDKVVFQGSDAHLAAYELLKIEKDMAGSDEVGTGDYFGPVCVAACIVSKTHVNELRLLGVMDSKKINDDKIKELAPKLIEMLPHTILILDDLTYNKVHKTNNLNMIKAKLHNQAYLNLQKKGYAIPKLAYVDEFVKKELYFDYLKNEKAIYRDLLFETKAEDKYIAVAAASIIARYAFLTTLEKMSLKYDLKFAKGAGEIADACALNFARRYGFERLIEVAKIHFKNTENLKAKL